MEARAADLEAACTGREEVDAAIDRTVWYAGWTDKLSQVLGGSNPVAGPYFDFTVPEPTGVVAILAPAEPPLLGLVSRVLPALAGGNVVVAVAYGLIVPDDVLAERLWLNVHPSLLPRWRGAAPVERAIMAGETETGVTIIELVKELDAGPIGAQEPLPIASEDDAGAVFARAAELAVDLLDGVLSDPAPAFREQSGESTYAEKITAEDRRLDLARPAAELVNHVRALSPHIGARAELHGRGVTIWRARVADDGAFEPLEVQPEGGRRMAYDDWLRGLR